MQTPTARNGPRTSAASRTQKAASDPDGEVSRRRSDTANLYELSTLEIIPALGTIMAKTFEANPKQFKNVPSNIAAALAKLHYRTGHDEQYLESGQRHNLVRPLLGTSDGIRDADRSAPFHQAAISLRQAAVDFVQRSFDTGERQLRNAFRDAAKTLYAYLTNVEGAVASNALGRLETHFADVVSVLRNSEYCGGLGLPPAPPGPWPRFGDFNGDGAALVEELSQRAIADDLSASVWTSAGDFVIVQRVANYGAATLDEILVDPGMDGDDRADEAINVAYRWSTAIRDYDGKAVVTGNGSLFMSSSHTS
jgi:hypothetical protein